MRISDWSSDVCSSDLLEEGRRVRAYANARDLIAELDPDELLARHRDRTLTELAGIGAATSAVIAEATDGKGPKKLTELKATRSEERRVGKECVSKWRSP